MLNALGFNSLKAHPFQAWFQTINLRPWNKAYADHPEASRFMGNRRWVRRMAAAESSYASSNGGAPTDKSLTRAQQSSLSYINSEVGRCKKAPPRFPQALICEKKDNINSAFST